MQQREVDRQSIDLPGELEFLSPPIVAQPYQCATVVQVSGYVSHAEIDVEVDGNIVATVSAGLPLPDGKLIELPDPLSAGQEVRAMQRTSTLQSPWSSSVTVRDHLEDYPAGPPRPQINPAPVYRCGARTGVANLLVGGNVWITADGAERGRVEGCNDHQGVNVNPDYGADEEVRAWFEMCEDPSPPSERHQTQDPPSPLPTPTFDPFYQDGEQVTVRSIVNGARVTLARGGTDIGTSRCWGGGLRWGVDPPCTDGESFEATQRMCPGDPPSGSGSSSAQPCSDLPAPEVGPVQYGDDRITLVDFVSDAVINVYASFQHIGSGSGPTVLLSRPIAYGETVYVEQVLGACRSHMIQEVTPDCVDSPIGANPSGFDLFPVGYLDYDDGSVKGSVYYPVNDDGEGEVFNERLAALGRVPIVVMAHGNHATHHDPHDRLSEGAPNCGSGVPADWVEIPNHKGYDYFQKDLAKMGIIAVSVDCNATNGCTSYGTSNIQDRVELILDSIDYFRDLDADPSSLFHERIDFDSVGLMGHSRGGNAVVWTPELNDLPGVNIRSVLALAPTSGAFSNGVPQGYAFMTILPAGDGDVVDNDGAMYYDRAQADPFKSQLYVHRTNHNFFNREWPEDESHGPTVMARQDHERILSAYGCAFFRSTLLGHDWVTSHLTGEMIPAGVLAERVHLSFEWPDATTVDNHEDGNGIGTNSMNQPTSQLGGMYADEYPHGQASGAYNGTFYGDSMGMVAENREVNGTFRSPLSALTDLHEAQIWIRAAEVYDGSGVPSGATGFDLGLEDNSGTTVWVDVDRVGGLPRPYDRRADDLADPRLRRDVTKTMLKTLRFRAECFSAADPSFDVTRVAAVLIRTNTPDQRALAFDDLQIVRAS